MDTQAVGRVVLMSINPPYVEAILAGTKRVEFRKRALAQDVTHVVIYATAPVCLIVGVFRVDGQHSDRPDRVWRRFRTVGGIDSRPFFDYFGVAPMATAIGIGEVTRLDRPLQLSDVTGLSRPPQSYQYVDARIVSELGTGELLSV